MHRNSVLMFRKYLQPLFSGGQRVLEIGPDKCPSTFELMVAEPTIRWETLDLRERPGLTYVLNGDDRFPIEDDSFDVVFSSQVIEHVRKPWLWLRELARVCRPGGHVLTINPVSWPYHEAPVDCWRIYPEGMRALHEDAGLLVKLSLFETLEVEATAGMRIVPGTSDVGGTWSGLKRLVKRAIGWPVLCAFDAVTVAEKAR